MNGRATNPRRRCLRGAALGASGAVALLVVAWGGCSIEKNYELLSFFFDGVPNPNALPITSTAGDPAALRASPTYVAHAPWMQEQCGECHKGKFQTSGGVDPSVCSKCHAEVPDEFPRMHGPVAASACLWCHVPHESAFPHLLKAEDRAVCSQCHEAGLLGTERVPEHADESRSCLECHTGHGGADRHFLREPPGDAASPAGGGGG